MADQVSNSGYDLVGGKPIPDPKDRRTPSGRSELRKSDQSSTTGSRGLRFQSGFFINDRCTYCAKNCYRFRPLYPTFNAECSPALRRLFVTTTTHVLHPILNCCSKITQTFFLNSLKYLRNICSSILYSSLC